MVAFKGRQLGIEGGDVFGAVVVGKLSETEFGQHGGALLGSAFFRVEGHEAPGDEVGAVEEIDGWGACDEG